MQARDLLNKHLKCGKKIRCAVSLYMSKGVGSNCVASPFYIELLLNLLRLGASGETSEKIKAMLPCNCTVEEASAAIKAAISALFNDKTLPVFMRNVLFVNQSCKVKEEFKILADHFFFAEVVTTSFTQPPPRYIVGDVIKRRIGDEFSKLVIWSLLLFQGRWEESFRKKSTNLFFYKTRIITTPVPSMTCLWEFDYCHCSELRARLIKLKFKGSDGCMVIVCPDDIDGLGAVEENICHFITLDAHHFQKRYIDLEMPMFRISGNFNFGDFFHKIGLEIDNPDFSGIAGEKSELFLNKVIQSFSFTVDEICVQNDVMCTALRPTRANLLHSSTNPPLSIVVNRPFAFFVKVKQLPIFAGRVVDPLLKKK